MKIIYSYSYIKTSFISLSLLICFIHSFFSETHSFFSLLILNPMHSPPTSSPLNTSAPSSYSSPDSYCTIWTLSTKSFSHSSFHWTSFSPGFCSLIFTLSLRMRSCLNLTTTMRSCLWRTLILIGVSICSPSSSCLIGSILTPVHTGSDSFINFNKLHKPKVFRERSLLIFSSPPLTTSTPYQSYYGSSHSASLPWYHRDSTLHATTPQARTPSPPGTG